MEKTPAKTKLITKNSKAFFDYFLSEFLEVGLQLKGTEIKSLRAHGATLSDSYVMIRNDEMFIINMHIAPYDKGNIFNHDPLRTRKLLANRMEIFRFSKAIKEKGLTVIPTKLYLLHGRAKLEIALGKGKKNYDKRETIKKREDEIKIGKAIKGQRNLE